MKATNEIAKFNLYKMRFMLYVATSPLRTMFNRRLIKMCAPDIEPHPKGCARNLYQSALCRKSRRELFFLIGSSDETSLSSDADAARGIYATYERKALLSRPMLRWPLIGHEVIGPDPGKR